MVVHEYMKGDLQMNMKVFDGKLIDNKIRAEMITNSFRFRYFLFLHKQSRSDLFGESDFQRNHEIVVQNISSEVDEV